MENMDTFMEVINESRYLFSIIFLCVLVFIAITVTEKIKHPTIKALSGAVTVLVVIMMWVTLMTRPVLHKLSEVSELLGYGFIVVIGVLVSSVWSNTFVVKLDKESV